MYPSFAKFALVVIMVVQLSSIVLQLNMRFFPQLRDIFENENKRASIKAQIKASILSHDELLTADRVDKENAGRA